MKDAVKLPDTPGVAHFVTSTLEVTASLTGLRKFIAEIPMLINYKSFISNMFNMSFQNIENVVKVDTQVSERTIHIRVFINESNWDLEDKIYEKYLNYLEENDNKNIRLEVIELLGRKPEDINIPR